MNNNSLNKEREGLNWSNGLVEEITHILLPASRDQNNRLDNEIPAFPPRRLLHNCKNVHLEEVLD
jgi:hypothetical protein